MSVTSESLLTDAQIPLVSTYKAVHINAGKRVLDLLAHALIANGVSQGTIARETQREPSAITRMLAGDQGLASDVFAAVLAHDSLGIVAAGVCGMVGFEARRIEPDPSAENKRLRLELARLRGEIDSVLGSKP